MEKIARCADAYQTLLGLTNYLRWSQLSKNIAQTKLIEKEIDNILTEHPDVREKFLADGYGVYLSSYKIDSGHLPSI